MTIPELIEKLEKIHSQQYNPEKGEIRVLHRSQEEIQELTSISYHAQEHSVFLCLTSRIFI